LILVVAVVILLISGYRPFPPSIFGKLTTAFQIILVFTIVFSAAYPDFNLAQIIHVLIYGVTFFSIFSALHYSFSTARHLSSSSS
jgi:phosphatidylglycerophosphate synthase